MHNFTYAVQITFNNETTVLNTPLEDLFGLRHSFVFYNQTDNSKQIVASSPRGCTEQDFHGMAKSFPIFKRKKLNQFVCFDFYQNFTLQGVYTDDYMSYAEILLELNPDFVKTKSFLKDKYKESISSLNVNQEIRKIFDNNLFKFELFYLETYTDVSDKNKPYFFKLDSTYSYVDLNHYKRHNIFFQQFNYTEDNNLFYNNYKPNSFMKLFSIQNIDMPISDRINSSLSEKNYLAKYIIRSINNQKLIKLSYIKIPEFLASLSGLLLNCLIILQYFMCLFNNLEAKQNIISKIMKYKDIIKSNNKKTLEYMNSKFDYEKFRTRRSRTSQSHSINSGNSEDKSNINNSLVKKNSHNIHKNYNLEGFQNDLDHFSKFPSMINFESANNSINIKDISKNKDEKDAAFFINTSDPIKDNEALKQKLNPNKNNEFYRIENTKPNQNTASKSKSANINSETDNDPKSYSNNSNISINKNPYQIYAKDIFSRLFCCKLFKSSKKHIIFENAERKFNHNLDMVIYMKKMQELEIIKYLLLDKNTLQLVNFISKPCISMSPKSIEDSEYKMFFENIEDRNSLSNQNIDDVKVCYDSILAKNDKSYLETRIIQLFEMQIEEIMD